MITGILPQNQSGTNFRRAIKVPAGTIGLQQFEVGHSAKIEQKLTDKTGTSYLFKKFEDAKKAADTLKTMLIPHVLLKKPELKSKDFENFHQSIDITG